MLLKDGVGMFGCSPFSVKGDRVKTVAFSASGRTVQLAAKSEKRAILLNVFPGKLSSIQKANTLRFTMYPKPHLVCKVS